MNCKKTLLLLYIAYVSTGLVYANNDSSIVANMLKDVWEKRYSNTSEAIRILDKTFAIAQKSNNPKLVADVYYYNAVLHYLTGKLDSCIITSDSSLTYYTNANNSYGQTSVYNLLGLVNSSLGEYNAAISYYLKSLEIAEKDTNLYAIANPFHNISIIYQHTNEHSKSLEYGLKALDIRKKIGDTAYIAESFLSVGGVYNLLNQFDSAELYLNDALKLFELQNHLLGTALALNNLGLVYKNQKLYKKAKNYYLRSLEISKTLEGRNEDLVNVFYNLGNIALAENEYYLAEKYAKEAEKIATDNNLLPSLKESLELLAKTAELKKDYKLAYNIQNRLKLISDSILNIEKTKSITQLEMKYLFAQKELTIAKQEKNIANAKRALYQKNILLIIVVFLGTLVSIVIYMFYQKKKQRLLQEEEQKINSAIFESEQKERVRIARDLHDSIGQKLAVMKMLVSQIDKNDNVQKVSNYIDETSVEVRAISHNLIPEIINFGLLKAIDDLCDRINITDNIKVAFFFDEELKTIQIAKQSEVTIYRIVQEILSNIVQHAKTEKIDVELSALQKKMQITIKDNGIGLDKDKIDFSTGLGWKNIFARVKLINGSIKIQSEKNVGTTFNLIIPI